MHSGGFELTKLTCNRLEDNLIRHRGDSARYWGVFSAWSTTYSAALGCALNFALARTYSEVLGCILGCFIGVYDGVGYGVLCEDAGK